MKSKFLYNGFFLFFFALQNIIDGKKSENLRITEVKVAVNFLNNKTFAIIYRSIYGLSVDFSCRSSISSLLIQMALKLRL